MESKYFGLIIFFVFFISLTDSYGQEYMISGKVREKNSNAALPFTHIFVNNNEAEALTNADGEFRIVHNNPIKTLLFKSYQFRPFLYEISGTEDSVVVALNFYSLFEFEEESDVMADRIIYNVLKRKQQNNAEKNMPHSYTTYNKLIVTTNRLDATKKLLEKNLKFLGIKLKPFYKDHNLFLVESVTEKSYLNDLNQKENILSSKISGIDETSIYTISSILLPSSIYNDYINVATRSFLGPLNKRTWSNYYFKVLDTVRMNSQTTYILKFSPAKKHADALKGLLYVNSEDYAVTHFIISPAYNSPPFEISQSYRKHEGKWFPEATRTNYVLKEYGRDNIRIEVVAKTFRSDLKWRKDLRIWDFNDVVLEYKKSASNESENFWKTVRKEPLALRDSNTYAFYDTIGSIQRFERYTRLGEGVYNGIIPIHKYNLEVNRVLSANEYEGLRIGLGGHTNSLFSDKYSFGGYLGYGTRDGKMKYGVMGKLIVDKRTEFTLSTSFYKDLREAAGLNFSFDRKQFSTENLRLYRLTYLDNIISRNLEASIKPVRYLYFTAGLSFENLVPTYAYNYREDFDRNYFVSEYKLGLKLAFGEQFIKSPQNKFLLSSKYPIFWLEFRKGYKDLFLGEYDYKRWDFKLQYSFKKPGIGKQTFQFNGGIAKGELPYFKLYNMHGSWRTFSVVIHNSFETMRYNEFLSDRYFTVHYAHDLGKIHIRKPKLSPGLEVLHSFGVGDLKQKADHSHIPFKTMEKGYLESGVYVYDILIIRALGMRTGLGTGVFVRYGPYSRDKLIDNFVYKLGLSFKH